MYRIYAENEHGSRIEISDIQQIPISAETLVFHSNIMLRDTDRKQLQWQLSSETGRRCIVLDARIGSVSGLLGPCKRND